MPGFSPENMGERMFLRMADQGRAGLPSPKTLVVEDVVSDSTDPRVLQSELARLERAGKDNSPKAQLIKEALNPQGEIEGEWQQPAPITETPTPKPTKIKPRSMGQFN